MSVHFPTGLHQSVTLTQPVEVTSGHQRVTLRPGKASVSEALVSECACPSELGFSCDPGAKITQIIKGSRFLVLSCHRLLRDPSEDVFQEFSGTLRRKLLYCPALLSLDRWSCYLESEPRALPPVYFKSCIQTQEFLRGSIESKEF